MLEVKFYDTVDDSLFKFAEITEFSGKLESEIEKVELMVSCPKTGRIR